MLGAALLVAGVNGYSLVRGYTPRPIGSGEYFMCLFTDAATPITIAMAAKGFVGVEPA